MIKNFLKEEDALGTVELLLILAGLVSVALIFKNQLVSWIKTTKDSIFTSASKGAGVDDGGGGAGGAAPAGN